MAFFSLSVGPGSACHCSGMYVSAIHVTGVLCSWRWPKAERGFANKLISFHNLMVVFLHQYCFVSLRHDTSSLFKYCCHWATLVSTGSLLRCRILGVYPTPLLQSILWFCNIPSFAFLKAVYLKWLWQLWLLGSFPLGCAVCRRYPWALGVL